MVSIVPFERIVYSGDLDYDYNRAYLRHESFALPFLLWLGQYNKRDPHNLYLNAAAKTRFCEFNFGETSLADAFLASSIDPSHPPEGISQSTLDAVQNHYFRNVKRAAVYVTILNGIPVLRSAFEDGLRRLDAMPDDIVDRVLDIVDTACPVSAYQRRSINTYLEERRSLLALHYELGVFEPQMIESARSPGLNAELAIHYKLGGSNPQMIGSARSTSRDAKPRQRSTYRFV